MTLSREMQTFIRKFRTGLLSGVLVAFSLLVLVPFIWMALMSLRTTGDILSNPYGLPTEPRWENYTRLMLDPKILFYRNFGNSIFVTTFSLVLTTILAALGGYGFGRKRYDFKFRGVLFSVLLLAMMLPPQVMYIPQFKMIAEYGLLNSPWSLVLLYAALGLPVSTYLMATYFSQLPAEMEDAARIDGCNDLLMFMQVMLPMARPALSTVILINFMYNWNELLLALTMVTEPGMRTIQVAMMSIVGEHGADYGLAAASLVTSMVPVLALYLILSDRFIEGMTAGALKG